MQTQTMARAIATIIFALAACAPARQGTFNLAPDNSSVVPGGTVITGEQLRFSGSVLGTLKQRVPGLRLSQKAAGCPELLLRGNKTLGAGQYPLVYVEGARVSDTCVLNQVSPWDVERIEVYPGGVSRRPGYQTSPYGLILVFMRGGQVR